MPGERSVVIIYAGCRIGKVLYAFAVDIAFVFAGSCTIGWDAELDAYFVAIVLAIQ